MKKTVVFSVFLFSLAWSLHGQHQVNDIRAHNGWYKIAVEKGFDGNSLYTITQCYPNGDEYELSDHERRQLPLWVKVFCISLYEETLKGTLGVIDLDEDGIYMEMLGFILMLDASRSDEEMLGSLDKEMVSTYKNKNW
jgi:hypothetical protein